MFEFFETSGCLLTSKKPKYILLDYEFYISEATS